MLSRPARTRLGPVTYLVLLTFGQAQLVPLAEAADWLRQRNTTYHFAMTKDLAKQLLPDEWYAAVNEAYEPYQEQFSQIFHETRPLYLGHPASAAEAEAVEQELTKLAATGLIGNAPSVLAIDHSLLLDFDHTGPTTGELEIAVGNAVMAGLSTSVAQWPSDQVAATPPPITLAHQPPPNQASLVSSPIAGEIPHLALDEAVERGAVGEVLDWQEAMQQHVIPAIRRGFQRGAVRVTLTGLIPDERRVVAEWLRQLAGLRHWASLEPPQVELIWEDAPPEPRPDLYQTITLHLIRGPQAHGPAEATALLIDVTQAPQDEAYARLIAALGILQAAAREAGRPAIIYRGLSLTEAAFQTTLAQGLSFKYAQGSGDDYPPGHYATDQLLVAVGASSPRAEDQQSYIYELLDTPAWRQEAPHISHRVGDVPKEDIWRVWRYDPARLRYVAVYPASGPSFSDEGAVRHGERPQGGIQDAQTGDGSIFPSMVENIAPSQMLQELDGEGGMVAC